MPSFVALKFTPYKKVEENMRKAMKEIQNNLHIKLYMMSCGKKQIANTMPQRMLKGNRHLHSCKDVA